MEEINKKPSIRFAEFTDAWEQRKLGKICNITTGKLDANAMIDNGQYDFYTSGVEVYKIDKAVFEGPAITIAGNGANVGYMHLADGKFNAYQRTYVLTEFLADRQFLNVAIGNKLPYKIQEEVRGSGIPYIVLNMLTDLAILSPCKEEQKKIGEYFKNLDNLITLHQRKCDQLGDIKKALLEKMFPSKNEYTPRIRFKGFTDAWEQRKVKEIAERFDNLRVPVASSQRVEGTTPYYGANGIQDYVNGFTHNGEFVLVAEDGANDLKNYPVQYVNGKIWVNNHAHVLQSNKNNNTMFLKYLIGSTDIESLLVGGGRAKLNAEVLMSIDLTLPNKVEQKQIAIFFDRLESLITLHQRECEKLKNIKKSLLEKMFA